MRRFPNPAPLMKKTITAFISTCTFTAAVAVAAEPQSKGAPGPATPNQAALLAEFPELQKNGPLSDEKLDALLRQQGLSSRLLDAYASEGKRTRKLLDSEEKAARVNALLAITTARKKEEEAVENLEEILLDEKKTRMPLYLNLARQQIEILGAREASLRHQMSLLRLKRDTCLRILEGEPGERLTHANPEALRILTDFSRLIEFDLEETRYLLKDEIDILRETRRIFRQTTLHRLSEDLLDPSITDSGRRKQLVEAYLDLQEEGQSPASEDRISGDKVKEQPLPIYLKLPLLQPRNHWTFTSPEQFLGCEITLTLARGDGFEEEEEISILKDGKPNPDWQLYEKDDGIYFLLRSKKNYIRSPKTRVTLRLKTDRDLLGRWGANRGILPAGEYLSAAFPKLYWNVVKKPGEVEYAYLSKDSWTQLWLLEPVPAD